MNRSFVHLGLVGKLLLAAFVPAQFPLVVLIAANRSGSDPSTKIEAMVIAGAVSLGISALLMNAVVSPIRRARHRLHELADTYHLVEPGTSTFIDDEVILGSLDRSIVELQEAGSIDPLTGAGNRRACQERLREDLARATRSDSVFSLAFFDLDGLKEVNDRYGHPAGDLCLMHLVDTMRSNVRDGDWIARWGGDEFVLVLWNANENHARDICDRVLAAVRDTPVQEGNNRFRVTASVGIAQAAPDQEPDSLLQNADHALLRSKREGRDRLSVFEWR